MSNAIVIRTCDAETGSAANPRPELKIYDPVSPQRAASSIVFWESRESGDMWKWHDYMKNLTSKPVGLSSQRQAAVFGLWSKLTRLIGPDIPPPIAGPGGELGFHMAWNQNDFYLDIEIAEDGSFEWFYKNRATGEVRGSDNDRLREPPEDLVRLLFLNTVGK